MALDNEQSSQDAWRIADRLYVGMRGVFGTPEQTPAVEDWGIYNAPGSYGAGYAAPTYDNWGNVIRTQSQQVQKPQLNIVVLALIAGGIYLLAKG